MAEVKLGGPGSAGHKQARERQLKMTKEIFAKTKAKLKPKRKSVVPTTPEGSARKRLMRAIYRFEKAGIERSWMGSKRPSDFAGIEQEWWAAHQHLIDTIESMHICETLAYWNPTEQRPKTARERKAYRNAWVDTSGI